MSIDDWQDRIARRNAADEAARMALNQAVVDAKHCRDLLRDVRRIVVEGQWSDQTDGQKLSGILDEIRLSGLL